MAHTLQFLKPTDTIICKSFTRKERIMKNLASVHAFLFALFLIVSGTPAQDGAVVPGDSLSKQPELSDNGIANGPVIGAGGRVALGALSSIQSRWGAAGWYVQPTGTNSQLRLKLSLPLSGSSDMSPDNNASVPDVAATIEHEWGKKYFGAGCGLMILYMQPFSRTLTDSYGNPQKVHFDGTWGANWVLLVRGGKPNAGFRGRLSWPIPLLSNGTVPDNYLIEYSALGVLGNDFIKGGIGVQGTYKTRKSVESANNSGFLSLSNDGRYAAQDLYVMVPCGKCAVCLGKHSVLALSADIAALFLPRPSGAESLGAPCVQVDYSFYFKSHKGADVLDGTF
jgi:hypothetical protein